MEIISENKPVIEVSHISKEYRVLKKAPGIKGALKGLVSKESTLIPAVSDLSFSIKQGEIVGFIGPNGAGKSTTIKMMSGILTPSGGRILIGGKDIQKQRIEVVKHIGVIFGQRSQLNWDLRLGESFELLRHIYQVDKGQFEETLDVMDKILGVKELLDKPTIGLDIGSKYALRKFVKQINEQRGTTIILTTHDLADIEQLCDRLIIINHGQLMEDGNLREIVDRIAPYKTLVVEYDSEYAPEHGKCEMFFHEANVAKYRFGKKDITAAKLIEDLSAKAHIRDVSIEEAGIDDIIRIAYGQ